MGKKKNLAGCTPPPRIFENQYFQNSSKYILLEFKREFICLVAKSDCTSNCFTSLKRTYWLIEIGGGRKCVRQGPIGCCQSCSYLWLDKLLFSSKILVSDFWLVDSCSDLWLVEILFSDFWLVEIIFSDFWLVKIKLSGSLLVDYTRKLLIGSQILNGAASYPLKDTEIKLWDNGYSSSFSKYAFAFWKETATARILKE